MFNLNLVRLSLFFLAQYFLLGCNLFEKEFILPLPVAQEANEVGVVGFTAHWKKVTGASSYEIDIALDQEFTQFVPNYQDKKVDALSLIIIGLEANTSYYYRVRANISNQTSQNSNVILVTTEALDTPVVYPATEVSATGFRAHWKKMPIATAYLLEVAFDEKFRRLVTNYDSVEVAPIDTSLLISNVEVDKQYFYRVKVKQSNSSSEYSNIQSVFTSTLPRPEVLPATSIQLTSLVANWKTMPEALSYRIDVASDALFQQMLAGYDDRAVNTNSIVVPNLDANTDYFYRVRAVNADATSNHSEVMTATTMNLSVPVATKASDIQSGGFQANWNPVPSAASYLLDVALDENFTQILPNYNSKAIIGNSEVIQSVDASTNYYYRVRAQGLNAISDYSNTILVVTGLLPAPVAEAASSQKAFEFTANWQAQAGISLYLLDVATDASFINFVSGYQAKEVAGTSLTVNGLDFRQTYYYRLRSKRLNKVSEYSNVIQINSCITATCKVGSLKFFSGGGATNRDQDFTYDAQNRLSVITYPKYPSARHEINYNSDNTIRNVLYYYNNGLIHDHIYTYNNGVLESIQQNDGVGNFKEVWVFGYDSQGRRNSWRIYSNISQTVLKRSFDYTYGAKDNVTEVRDQTGTLIRKYDYDDKLSPYAIFHPDLCFYLATNRDNWTNDSSFFDENEFRGFLPTNNIIREQIVSFGLVSTEVFIFETNNKDIAIAQDAFYSVAFQFIGCNF
ncbi:MAG TPA: hypothetical protein DCS93_27930 [Microscillaceae bacterium]|nr:hypothetical protein [Microscillaceae bacterium]